MVSIWVSIRTSSSSRLIGVSWRVVFLVILDVLRSQSLVNIARSHAQHTAVVADNLNLPHPDSTFDFAISIAVVHHLSTPARRVKAIECILNTLKVTDDDPSTDARALIYVWALEQKSSRRGWDKGDEQDVMVPWIMKQKTKNDPDEKDKVFQRYYHLYQSGELDNDIISAGGRVLNAGFEKDNWWAIATRKTPS